MKLMDAVGLIVVAIALGAVVGVGVSALMVWVERKFFK
jgi:hypothetical protein